MKSFKVYPKESIGGTGYIWEYMLSESGWNDLPKKYKYLLVTKIVNGTYDIICPFTDFSYWAFKDEVSKVDLGF